MKTAVLNSSGTLVFNLGPNSTMPNQSDFLPLFGPDLFLNPGYNGPATWTVYAEPAGDNPPTVTPYLYAFDNAGYVQYTAPSFPFTGLDFSGGFQSSMNYFADDANVTLMREEGGGVFTIADARRTGIGINDGSVFGALTLLGSETIDLGLPLTVGFSANMSMPIYGGTEGTVTFLNVSEPGVIGNSFMMYPDGGGGYNLFNVFEVIISGPAIGIPSQYFGTIFSGGRYNSVLNSFDTDQQEAQTHVDWTPQPFGGGYDANVDLCNFDNPALNALFGSPIIWPTADAFYVIFTWDGIADNINPIILKVAPDWSSYDYFDVVGEDAFSQDIINNFVGGLASISFAYSPTDDAIVMAGGLEPNLYSYGGPGVIPTPPTFSINGFGIKLECSNYCIPLLKQRKR